MIPALGAATAILRASVALCFLGHGAVALMVHRPWLSFFAPFGISEASARVLLPLVGVLDVVVAALVLLWPCRALWVWTATWALFTAALRPLCGGELLDVIVRAANWGPPLALLVLSPAPGWWRKMDLRAVTAANRRGAMAVLLLATAGLGAGLAARGVASTARAWDHLLDVLELLEGAGNLGVPAALAILAVGAARSRRHTG